MVKKYLEKTKESFILTQLDLQEQVNNLQIHLKENIEFIKLLEESCDPNYESFTPREVNSYHRKKIQELKNEQKQITSELNQARTKLVEIDYKIGEIDSVIKVARENITDDDYSKKMYDRDIRIALLETQEHERQRIARDLHDTTVQNLTSLVHKSELCMKLVEMDPNRCKSEIFSMSKIIRSVIDETRKIIYDLRPMSFDDIGFDVTVERYIERLKNSYPIQFNYVIEGDTYHLKSIIEISLLRVIQEACSNSIKHGNPSFINISLNYQPEQVVLMIEDDGKGFDFSSISEENRSDNSGFGLSMMKERIYLLSGKIDFDSSVNNGFKIMVQIPNVKEEV